MSLNSSPHGTGHKICSHKRPLWPSLISCRTHVHGVPSEKNKPTSFQRTPLTLSYRGKNTALLHNYGCCCWRCSRRLEYKTIVKPPMQYCRHHPLRHAWVPHESTPVSNQHIYVVGPALATPCPAYNQPCRILRL